MRFGCCAGLDTMQMVQDAGFDYIEMPVGLVKPELPASEFEPIREEILNYDIRPEAWNGFLPANMKITGPEVDEYRVERYLRTACERVEELGGETIVFGSSGARNVPEGFPMDEARDQVIHFLTLAGRIAGTYGITIAIEPLYRNECNIINTVREGSEFVRAVDHPFVKLLADLYHVVEEHEPMQDIIDAGSEIVHLHVADAGRKHPGSGMYPFREFFAALKAISYDDRVSIECVWDDFRRDCRASLEFVRAISGDARSAVA